MKCEFDFNLWKIQLNKNGTGAVMKPVSSKTYSTFYIGGVIYNLLKIFSEDRQTEPSH